MMRILVLTVLIALGMVVQRAKADDFGNVVWCQTVSRHAVAHVAQKCIPLSGGVQAQGPAPNHLLRNSS